jgi:hypothetical protein
MQKSLNLTTVGIALILSLWKIALLKKAVIAQEYPGCFLINQSGTLINLKNLCTSVQQQQVEPLLFNGLEFQPPLVGLKAGEIRGAVTNRSSQVVPLKIIYIQLVADNQIIALSDISVETGNGLQPGESLSFDTVISSKKLGKVPENGVKVQVARYE